MRKPASIISLNGSSATVRSNETSAKLCYNVNMIDSNERYAATRLYQQRNEDNSHNSTRRKYRQQHEAYQEHIVSKLPEKSFTR